MGYVAEVLLAAGVGLVLTILAVVALVRSRRRATRIAWSLAVMVLAVATLTSPFTLGALPPVPALTSRAAVPHHPAPVPPTLSLFLNDFSDTNGASISALRAMDGSRRWQYQIQTSAPLTYTLSAGMIFIPSDAPLTSTGISGAPAVTALRASDGTQLWSKSISHTTRTGGWPGAYSDPISGLPVAADGHVYVGLANTQGGIGMIVALRTSDGHELWHRQIDHFDPRLIDRPLSAGDDLVFVAGIGALRATDGTLAWTGIGDGVPVYHDGVVYINALFGSGPGMHIRALIARDGRELWTSDNLRGPDSTPRVIRTLSVGSDMVYVSLITAENGHQAYLAALDAANGTQRWLVPLPGEPLGMTATGGSNGVVYVGTTGNLVALNAANGSSLWRQSTGSFVNYHQPQVAADVVFVTSTYNQPSFSPCTAKCGESDYINALSARDGSFYRRVPLAWAGSTLAVA